MNDFVLRTFNVSDTKVCPNSPSYRICFRVLHLPENENIKSNYIIHDYIYVCRAYP